MNGKAPDGASGCGRAEAPCVRRMERADRTSRQLTSLIAVQDPGPTAHHAPLHAVLDLLPAGTLTVHDDFQVAEQCVSSTVLWDALEPVPARQDGILLLVGTSPRNPQLGSLLPQCGSLGYSVVVIKDRGEDLSAVVDAAATAGLLLLVASESISWSTAEAMLEGAIAQNSASSFLAVHESGDLFAIANAIATLACAAVTIEDSQRKVLAHSNIEGQAIDSGRQGVILGRRVPSTPEYDAEYLTVARATGHVRFPPESDGELARLAVPVRIGGRLLGSLWAIDDGTGQAKRVARSLETAAPLVAVELLAAAAREDAERRRSADRLAAQLGLSGVDRSATLRRDIPLALMGFGLLRREDGQDQHRVTQIARVAATRISQDAVCAAVGEIVYVMLPRVQVTAERLHRVADSVLIAAGAGSALNAGFTAQVTSTGSVVHAREDIVTALEALHGSPGRIVDIDVDRHLVILQEVRRAGVADPQRLVDPVRILREHDARHATSYADTLRTHLDHGGDVRASATALGIHENSHRYRMNRIAELLGDRLGDPEQRLVTWLQLRLLRDPPK